MSKSDKEEGSKDENEDNSDMGDLDDDVEYEIYYN
jgi:hypothetical protein